MNHIKNDKGEIVIAIGAPYSPARIKCEYPKLIERINSLWYQQALECDAIDEIRNSGIKDYKLTNLILNETLYSISDNA